MFVRKLALFSVFVSSAVTSAFAQSEARVRVVIPSVKAVEDDLKWLIELSPKPDLQKQWKTLKSDFLDAFTQGVDESKPLALDLVFRKDLGPPRPCNTLPSNRVCCPAGNNIGKRFVGVVKRHVNVLFEYSFQGIASFSQQKAAASQDIKYAHGHRLALVQAGYV